MIVAADLTKLKLGKAHTAALSDMLARIVALEKPPVVVPPVVVPPAEPPASVPARALGPHYMLSDLPDNVVGQARAVTDVQFMKSVRQRFAFAFTDGGISKEFNANEGDMYGRRMQWLLDAGAAQGVPMVPQMQGGNTPQCWADFFRRTLDHPAILRHNGRPVVAVWNWKPVTDAAIAFARAQFGAPVEVWACVDWWELMGPGRRPNGLLELHDDQARWDQLDVLLHEHPLIDGLLNFAVGGNLAHDDPAKPDKLIEQNSNLVKFCRAAGKTPIPGFAPRYHDKVMLPENQVRVLDNITSLNTEFATLTSANDWGESGTNRPEDMPTLQRIIDRLALTAGT